MLKRLRHSRGFTLLEVMFTMVVIGLLTVLMIPYGQMILTAKKQSYNAEQTAYNAKIAQGLLNFVRNGQALGINGAPPHTLPMAANMNDFDTTYQTKIRQYILDQGVPSNMVFSDGTAGNRSRLYQSKTGIPVTMPLYGHSGPNITLNYDYAVVYSSECPQGSSSNGCVPGQGKSTALVDANYNTWTPSGTDFGTVTISTLSIQKELLDTTVQRMNALRDAMANLARTKMLNAAPDSAATANFYPYGGPMSTNPSNDPTVATQQGCRTNWADLSRAGYLPVLNQLGLSADYGTTAWGGAIEYCLKYDPAGTGAYTAAELLANPQGLAPHYAAIRFNKFLSSGLSPGQSGTDLANNIIIAF